MKYSYFKQGQKIGLRSFERDDLEHFKKWFCDERVTEYLEMGSRPYTPKALELLYTEACESPNAVAFIICDVKTGQAVGSAGLYLINWEARRAQYRILIGNSDFHGKGIGSEVNALIIDYGFKRLNLHNIYLGVNAENEKALKSYKKSGFVEEGRQRDFIFNNGRYYDCIVMSLLASDYLKF